MNILVNLPAGFFAAPSLGRVWERLSKLGAVRQTSHDTPDEIRQTRVCYSQNSPENFRLCEFFSINFPSPQRAVTMSAVAGPRSG